jgi:cell division transport system permease protein
MSVSYTVRESLAGFKRNRSATLITIFTVSISLLLLGIFAVISLNLSSVVEKIRDRVDIEAFLKDPLTADQLRQTERAMKHLRGIDGLRFVSKEEAARIWSEDIGQDFNDILEANPLPASYRLSLAVEYNNPDSARSIVVALEKMQSVESVTYRKQFLSLIDTRARALRYATLFIGIVLALSAVILVANTIRLTIYAKREIIRTMKLVGATSWFIRLPFLLEGMFHGLMGGLLASLLIEMAFAFFIRPLAEDLLVTVRVGGAFYAALVLTGCVLGLIGSVLSIGRFLKEALVSAS